MGAIYPATAARNLTAGVWTHVALVVIPAVTTLDIYQDGQRITHDTAFTVTPVNPTGQSWVIGAWWSSPAANFFKGALDEVLLYNRPLVPVEVQQLYALSQHSGPGLLRRVVAAGVVGADAAVGPLVAQQYRQLRTA